MAARAAQLDKGWAWAVMLASFSGFFVLGGTNYSVGLIHKTLLEHYGEDNTRTAWAGALHTALMNLAGPLSSVMVDKISCRATIITSGILFTAGYLGTAFAPSLGVSIFTCGVIAGLAGGFGWTCNMVCMGFYFRRYLNLAQGFAFSGVGVGLFGMAPAIEVARESYGHFGFFITLAGFSVHLIVFGMLMAPSKLEIETQRKRRLDNKTSDCSFIKGYMKVFLCKSVMCLSVSMFTFSFAIYILFLNLPIYCIYQGTTPLDASFLLSICGVASILGRFLTGFASSCDEVDEILLYSASMGIIGICSFLFPSFSYFYSGQIAFSTILGFYFGCCYVVISTINIQHVGIKNMAAALGIELFFGGIGAMLGPIVSGILLDAGASYEVVFAVAGLNLILSCLLGLITVLFSKGQVETTKQPVEVELEILPATDTTRECKKDVSADNDVSPCLEMHEHREVM